MSEYDVVKPFKSVNRRFNPNDERSNVVRDGDDLQPLSIETLEQRGFIKAKEPKGPVAVPLNKLDTAIPTASAITPAAAPATSEK